MSKSKRKVSSAQRNKVAIQTAKILKKKGILSKQTKLHGGKFISRSVLKKVQEFQHVARPSYTSVKVSKAVAATAKAEGYQVVQGNRIIVPKDHDFIKRVKKGMVTGLKPVKGGFMSEVQIPFEGKSAADLLNWIEEGNLDALKLEQEHFAFRLTGNEGSPGGMSYRTFPTKDSIRDYLRYYSPATDTTGFKLYRLHPEDTRKFILSRNEREKWRKANRGSLDDKGNRRVRKRKMKTPAERIRDVERTNPVKAEQMRQKNRERDRKRYEARKNDPKFMERARNRARRSYEGKKK